MICEYRCQSVANLLGMLRNSDMTSMMTRVFTPLPLVLLSIVFIVLPFPCRLIHLRVTPAKTAAGVEIDSIEIRGARSPGERTCIVKGSLPGGRVSGTGSYSWVLSLRSRTMPTPIAAIINRIRIGPE